MRTTRVVSISLPEALFEQAKALAAAESRTMSELLREALRRYQREQTWTRLRSFGTISAPMEDLTSEQDIVELVKQTRREMRAEEFSAKAS